MDNNIKAVVSGAIAGFIAYLCDLNWELIMIWFALMVIDVIYGVTTANKRGEYKSGIMKKGLFDKVGEFFLLFTMILAQRVAIINGINVPISGFFIGAFCFKEATSILETYMKAGHKLPPSVERWFKMANEQINESVEEGEDIDG